MVDKYKGFATNDHGQLVYTEEHEVHYRNGNSDPISAVTTYYDPENHEIAKLESHFGIGGLSLPDYTYRDERRHYEDGVVVSEDSVRLFRNDHSNGHDDDRAKTIAREKGKLMMAGQGFHYFVREHLPEIEKGSIDEVQFLLPSRLDGYGFRISVQDEDPKSNVLKIRLEASSWLLRIFAPHLDARYDKTTHRLIYYKGASNILTPHGDVQNVEIRYEFPN